MRDVEIERRLRLPAPEEPGILPALVLPIPEESDRLGAVQVRARFLERRQSWWSSSPRMILAVLGLLVAMAAAVVAGAMRLNLIPNPFDPDAGLRMRGISIDIPEGWVRLTAPDPLGSSLGFTVLIASNVGVEGCSEEDLPPVTPAYSGRADQVLECVLEKPMEPGEIRLAVSQSWPQLAGNFSVPSWIGTFDHTEWFGSKIFDLYIPTASDGWTETIDGWPAKLVVAPESGAVGSDESRTWAVINPAVGGGDPWFISASLRGPDLEALRAQADDVARSFHFEVNLPTLDAALRDDAVGHAIDDTDRETRLWRGSDLFGCFPRKPGEQSALLNDRLFEYGPDGPLAEPVPVTCTTAIEPTSLRLWHVTLIVSWDAGDGYPAGHWDSQGFVDGNGTHTYMSGALFRGPTLSPGSVGTPPPPLEGPLVIPVGSIVEVLPPGIDSDTAPFRGLAEEPNATIGDLDQNLAGSIAPGRRFYVVEGPVAHVGVDWYRLEINRGAGYPSAFGWTPASTGNRPLLMVVEPRCPTGDVGIDDLLDMIPAERMLCFGSRELTLGPTILALDGTRWPGEGEVQGTPDWLAKDTLWRLFGPSGPDGVEPPLPVAIAPSLGTNVPSGTWITVHGHFSDPASSTCRRSFPEGWGAAPEPRDVQILQCRELFVITSFEERGTP